MANWPEVNFESIGVMLGSCLATVLTVLGIQKKTGGKVPTSHDKGRTEIRELQDSYLRLEGRVDSLKEKLAEQQAHLALYEQEQKAQARLMFDKLDAMTATLNDIKVSVGIVQAKRHD